MFTDRLLDLIKENAALKAKIEMLESNIREIADQLPPMEEAGNGDHAGLHTGNHGADRGVVKEAYPRH